MNKEIISHFLIKRFDITKIEPYKFNAIPIKISLGFLTELD